MKRNESSFYIPSLDGLRALAVMWVFLAHAGLIEQLVPGNFGVTVFFFLSGFLITTLMRKEFDRTGSVSLRAFYLRRALRILPPLYLVLAAASVLTFLGALEGSLRLDAVLAQVAHLSNYFIIYDGWWNGRAPGTWVYWSLAVEEHFYLAFPLCYLLLRRFVPARRHQALLLLGACAAILAWRLVLVFGLHALKDRTYVATDTRVDSILFGCILAVYGNPVLDRTRVSERWWKLLWLPLGLVGILVSFGLRDPRFQETIRYTLQGLSLFPLFVVAVRYPDWTPCRLLNLRWIKLVGVLSYSVYLMHTTILYAVLQWTDWSVPLRAVTALALSLLLAGAMYVCIEQPCARLRRRLSRIGDGVRAKSSPEQAFGPEAIPAVGSSRATESPWLAAQT